MPNKEFCDKGPYRIPIFAVLSNQSPKRMIRAKGAIDDRLLPLIGVMKSHLYGVRFKISDPEQSSRHSACIGKTPIATK
jgi:hypothetical protein